MQYCYMLQDMSRSIGAQMLLTMDDMALNVPLVSDEVININDSICKYCIEIVFLAKLSIQYPS